MKKLIERLLIFFIGVPAVYALVVLLPFYHHLALNIIVILFSALGAVEFSAMLEKKNIRVSKTEAFIFGALAPLSATLTISFSLPGWIIPILLMAGALWAVLARAFTAQKNMDNVISYITGVFSVIAYPGLFMYWMIKMTSWENSGAILLFLFITFGNDSSAWFLGSLLGKNNKGIIPASPNKSIAGFFGGFLGTVIISGGAAILFPSVFFAENCASSLIIKSVILGIFTGIFANLGDLAESALKRSCDFKDSGKLILGRGGILDSIDSVAVAAPVFFFLYSLCFLQ
ncbi:MAG: phosphatidate cytidylyltransferase [Treponema sp.]|jgi:phosphatidate cytidylyltransferase|nr:phosphatidate cytidylyltransferase [Treponema sp.]